ncbi:MAG: arsenate reductase (azurin) small subunit [Gammaproteobacteria bacterium]|nr:arsenate reductase (azurin) small subunit [Gammaproteobacteria bacterium]
MLEQKTKDKYNQKGGCLMTRRSFLFRSTATVAGTVLLSNIPGFEGQAIAATVSRYPRQKIGKLSQLKTGIPVKFNYPDTGGNSGCMLVKLVEKAGGGLGPGEDVIAFNTVCTHMGGDMKGAFKAEHSVLGQCPLHQSTFDLTRHGMIISGHATESLPQVLLELEGDDIYAVGVMGLIYGRYDNLKA